MEITIDIVLIVTLILAVLNIIERIILFKGKAKQPQEVLNQRVSTLEDRVEHIEIRISADSEKINELELSTRVLMKSIGALLSHGIDGNNTDEMKVAREELNDYLISR